MIKISTEKLIVGGVQKRRIVRIEALKEMELPLEYVQGFPSVRLSDDGSAFLMGDDNNNSNWMYHNQLWDEESFKYWLGVIKVCGDRLRDINKRLGKKNKDWKGKETFFI